MDLNIVSIFENNPITRLSSEENNTLLSKFKASFVRFEEQFFFSNFYCYLNSYNTNDFVIDLDNIWSWLGFNVKIHVIKLLEKNFTRDIDYIISQQDLHETHHKNNNKIMLNISTFKSLCLLSNTERSKQLHFYFIKLEELLNEVLEEQAEKLREEQAEKLREELLIIEENRLAEEENRLAEEQNRLAEEQNRLAEEQKAVEETLFKKFPINTECVYFGTISNTNELGDNLIKFGYTNDLHNRVLYHKTIYDNFILLEAFEVKNEMEIENLIKMHHEIKNQIRTIQVNEKNKINILAYDNNKFTINDITKCIKEVIHSTTYSFDKFQKLLKHNQELLNVNEELKRKFKNYNEIIGNQSLEISELNEKLKLLEVKLEEFERENNADC